MPVSGFLPSARTKNSRDHRIPLARQAVAILDRRAIAAIKEGLGPLTLDRSRTVDEEISKHVIDFLAIGEGNRLSAIVGGEDDEGVVEFALEVPRPPSRY